MTIVHPRAERGTRAAILAGLGAGALLALFVLALYARLLFTNRVLAGGDIQLYFYAYWEYVAVTLREGRLPFWNPYLFLGAPLLANPQTAVLYPLHWPLIWLPVTKQIYWSAALHTWLLALGGYALLRRWGYGFAPALMTGLVLAGSGFVGGLIGHINQLNGAAWLTWGALCLAHAQPATESPWHRRSAALLLGGAAFALLVALMVLAGHTQTVFINLFSLGVWVVWPLLAALAGWLWTLVRRRDRGRVRGAWSLTWPALAVYAGGVIAGALLAAPQLLPTLELSALGLRSGGLGYGEASSFSLKPLQLAWTLLPTYGLADLSAVFDTPGYTEFVAYVGVVGLALGAIGAWRGRGPARAFGLLFAGMGLFLALGRWNPVYFLLYQVVPGFDLFRAPARWMMLYTVGVAVLAGVGLAWLLQRLGQARSQSRMASAAAAILIAATAAELLLAARALPHTHPTAPQAVYDARTAPAHLLTDPARAAVGPAAAGRFLGMSTITYDPGDMADYRRIFVEEPPPQLDEEAFHDLVIAQKVQELLVPNLPLFWRIPAVDGFDGGVLPLQRYIRFAELLVPPDRLVPDGRLREQVREMPASDLLAMLNVDYVVTDKVRDLWFEDVFYDRQIGADLRRVDGALAVDAPLPLSATHVDLIGYVDGDAAALAAAGDQLATVATLEVIDSAGQTSRFPLTAGGAPGAHFADGALESPMAARAGSVVAYRDVEGGRQEYRARIALPAPVTADALRLTPEAGSLGLVVQAATLYDERTGMFAALLPSDRGRFQLEHSGDVKVYRNLDNLPRAYLARAIAPVADLDAALAVLREHAGRVTAVEGLGVDVQPAAPGDTAAITAYAPERVVVHTSTAGPALLVLSDSFYPGWSATVDGAPAPIYAANALFRGVVVPAGSHEVIFEFAPAGWAAGLWLAALGGLLLLLALSAALWLRRTRRTGGV